MNLILRKEPKNRGGLNLAHYQMEVRAELLQMLQRRRRNGEEEVWPQEEYVWNRLDESTLVPPPRNYFEYRPKDIFAPHYKVNFPTFFITIANGDIIKIYL